MELNKNIVQVPYSLIRELTEKAQKKLVIPMMGQVESLNAATAATVFSYEILRQRMSKQR